ncbi:MAG: hypothetical protein M3463_01820 [Verrucomicrobiota bacterium]|nr:hypothetical protein [Verrucomicrobiota bacterium]
MSRKPCADAGFRGEPSGSAYEIRTCTSLRAVDLPDRGPAYYRERLRSGRATLLAKPLQPGADRAPHRLLRDVIGQCEVVDPHWGEVARWCEGVPRTFIQGDFVPKNISCAG